MHTSQTLTFMSLLPNTAALSEHLLSRLDQSRKYSSLARSSAFLFAIEA